MSKETRRDVIGVGSVKFEEPVSIWTALGVALIGQSGVCRSCGEPCPERMCAACSLDNAGW